MIELKRFPFNEESYKKELEQLFNRFPLYQNIGSAAYKPGIEGMRDLDEASGNPHKRYLTIHIAGTNGKGSVSHMIASVLQHSGLKTGLYTSPHLVDFRERIKINGQMIDKEYVYNFMLSYNQFCEEHKPSFFEISTAMAFRWFADSNVDIAVIETGLGGRLDSTNIINPIISIITNIGLDHCEYLGSTLGEIAREKAGIIKEGVPVVIGEADASTANVFRIKAGECDSRIVFAEDFIFRDVKASDYNLDLYGSYQDNNIRSVLTALSLLYEIPSFSALFGNNVYCDAKKDSRCWCDENIRRGLSKTASTTGLRGRWEKLSDNPLVICDTGHNAHGLKFVFSQLEREVSLREGTRLFIIIGFVAEKDITHILGMMPRNAFYIYTNASVQRALKAGLLAEKCSQAGFEGVVKGSVRESVDYFRSVSKETDTLFIGGSTFVVAEALNFFEKVLEN